MQYIDPHIHMISRVTDDYHRMAQCGCVAISEPAFWAGFDRGSADSHYGRSQDPHYYPEGTYRGDRVEPNDMTIAEMRAYFMGYEFNERFGDKKEY